MSFPKRSFRLLAAITLFFFTWITTKPWTLAAAAENPQTPPSSTSTNRVKTVTEKFEDSVRAAKQFVEKLDQEVAEGKDISGTLDNLKKHRQIIEDADIEIQAEFAATESSLEKANLPQEILDRHRDAVAEYEANYQQLLKNLQAIDQIEQERKGVDARNDRAAERAKSAQLKQRIKEARKHLGEKVKEPPHTPLDPNNLPHRTPKVKERKPRLRKEEFSKPKKSSSLHREEPIRVASLGLMTGLLASATDLPTEADLAETIEVQFTQKIKDLAAELEKNPVKIYNWVRNNIDFVPTYGSIQGAQMCLFTKRCNDVDTASLLIALLRASGIGARYVIGTIQLPIDQVMNWVGGFTDAQSALNFIASGGTPVAGVTSGGKIVAAQLEHVWVEAFVDYVPSRGAVHKEGDTWVPMDASFKQFTFTPGIDVQAAVPFDAEAFANQVESTATVDETAGFVSNLDAAFVETTFNDLKTQLQNFIDTNLPDATVEDLVGKKTIKAQEFPILPGTLPYETIIIGSNISTLDDDVRHKLTFGLATKGLFGFSGEDMSFTATMPELMGRRVTLSYIPATAADQETVDAFGGLYETPPYLIEVKPQLKVEGVVKAEGKTVGMGVLQKFTMDFSLPNQGPDRVQNDIPAGGYYAIGLVPDQLPSGFSAVVAKRGGQLTDFVNAGGDRLSDAALGEQLYLSAISYFWQVDRQTDAVASVQNVVYAKQPGEGIFGLSLAVSTLFGAPRSVKVNGTNIDVDRSVYFLASKSGDSEVPFAFLTSAGALGSSSEHAIIEQIYGVEGISAVKTIQLANLQGLKTYRITSSNLDTVVPILQVSNAVKADIQNAINAGKEVVIPESEIQVSDWKGVGYIVSDPDSGAGAYLINGGIAGGAAAQAMDLLGIADNPTKDRTPCLILGLAGPVVIPVLLGALIKLPVIIQALLAAGLLGVIGLIAFLLFTALVLFFVVTFVIACIDALSEYKKNKITEYAYGSYQRAARRQC